MLRKFVISRNDQGYDYAFMLPIAVKDVQSKVYYKI